MKTRFQSQKKIQANIDKVKAPLYAKRKLNTETNEQSPKRLKTQHKSLNSELTTPKINGSTKANKNKSQTRKQKNSQQYKTNKRSQINLNKSYRPGDEKRKRPINTEKQADAIRMRTDNRKFIDDKNPIKSTFILNTESINTEFLKNTKFVNYVEEKFTGIESYRPVEIIEYDPETRSPLKAQTMTPSKEILEVHSKVGIGWFMMNEKGNAEKQEIVETIPQGSNFFQSKQYKIILSIITNFKQKSLVITQAGLKKIGLENQFSKGRNQNIILVNKGQTSQEGSVNKYVEATGEFEIDIENNKFEWLHLIAFMILGNQSQSADNIVGGTGHANTIMMMFEAELKSISKAYPDGFTLRVKGELIPHTHIAKTINYEIVTKDFSMPLLVNAQTKVKPHVDMKKYLHNLVKSFLNYAKNSTAYGLSPDKIKQENPKMKQTLFYNRQHNLVRNLFSKPSEKKDRSTLLQSNSKQNHSSSSTAPVKVNTRIKKGK